MWQDFLEIFLSGFSHYDLAILQLKIRTEYTMLYYTTEEALLPKIALAVACL